MLHHVYWETNQKKIKHNSEGVCQSSYKPHVHSIHTQSKPTAGCDITISWIFIGSHFEYIKKKGTSV